MKVPKATARLAAVVKACGRPEPVTLWVNPRKNLDFQEALETNRVMTIKQETVGARKDFGVVGFFREANVSYWVFRKPLDAFDGKRIIGIDYGVLQAPRMQPGHGAEARPRSGARSKKASKEPVRGRAARGLKPPAPPAAPPRPAPPKALPRFRVRIRCVSFVELERSVEAATKAEAKEKALASLSGQKIDFSRGTQSRTAVKIERVRDHEKDSPAAVFRRLRGLPDLREGEDEK